MMNELMQLAGQATYLLGPALPLLLDMGGKALDTAAATVVREEVKALWKRLRGPVEQDPDLGQAARDLALAPDSAAEQERFATLLARHLATDAALRAHLERLLARPEQRMVAERAIRDASQEMSGHKDGIQRMEAGQDITRVSQKMG